MALIEVKFDPTIDQKDIKIPLVYSSESEGGKNYTNNKTESLQTKLYGIVYPLISIDDFIIDYGDILSFSLKSKDVLPTLKVTVRDKYGLMEYFDTGGRDNEVNVQIIPRFNDTYKKISLSFFITSKKIQGDSIILTCTYKNKDLLSSQFKALGELSTYETFEQIAKETKLGFASNTQSPQPDNRWMYCNYISYLDLMDREVQMGGDETNIFDYWIDFWNNINYVNMFDRYNNKDKEKIYKEQKALEKLNYKSTIITDSTIKTDDSAPDSLATKWGYELFKHAHNEVCSRVLDSCFNGIYEACGTPPNGGKCATGQSSNCPYNFNSRITLDANNEINLLERGGTGSVNSSAACFGYTNTTVDPYSNLRGPVADARRSIMNKYLLDANADCDLYGEQLRATAQNIGYQKVAAQQALQQKVISPI